MTTFKQRIPFEMRKSEADHIRVKFPTRIPVIAERAHGCTTVPKGDKAKYLVPSDLTVGQFVYALRKRIHLPPENAIFVFVNGTTLPPTSALMLQMDDAYADKDGFLYMTYNGEATFG